MSGTPLPFRGKTVLVTGAGSGIGLAIARQFLREGASIVAEDINPEVEQTFAGDERVAILVADAGKEESAIQAVELARLRFGRLDVLVNNAARIRLQVGSRDDVGGLEHNHGCHLHWSLSALSRSAQSDDAKSKRIDREHRVLRLLPVFQRHKCLRGR